MEATKLSKNLKFEMTRRGMSIMEFSEFTKVPYSSMQRFLCYPEYIPNWKNLARLCEALNTSPRELLYCDFSKMHDFSPQPAFVPGAEEPVAHTSEVTPKSFRVSSRDDDSFRLICVVMALSIINLLFTATFFFSLL